MTGHSRWLSLRLSLAAALVVGAAALLAQPRGLRYGPQGDHSEGLIGDQKSSSALLLVSAVIDGGRESSDRWPENLRLRFFLPKDQAKPSIELRQLQSLADYYVMDKVTPKTAWTAGSANEYSWRSDLMQAVYEHQIPEPQRHAASRAKWLANLGLVVTLGADAPGSSLQKLTVAPAVIRESGQPVEVSGYRFTFKSTMQSTLVTGTLKSAAGRVVLSGLKYPVWPGTTFTVPWSLKEQYPDGWYTLTMEATSVPGEPHVEVVFFHKRSL